ncbi:ABC transporter substrate-binding protein [Rhizobium leguminosarum]|uniref:ABC transporter substrate-binding protein n=1 Tax=Rhizobium leguminosarum TaxID=384 RepID=UPI001C983779|nr:ABC transporter substrate-binding protein [Rhizobium leguminosarum]
MKYNRLYAYGLIASIGVAMTANANQASAQDDKSVSVLHYWTAGGEAAAMNAAKTAFEKLGGKWIDQPVSGGGGDTHDQVLRSRILAGDAPGAAIPKVADVKAWYEEGYVVNIDAVATTEKWDSVLPASIADVLKVDGHYMSVPTNIHRFNALWANAQILKEHGIAMPKTWDEFNAAAEKLKSAGIIPLAHGGQSWQESILFEIVVAGIGGPDFFRKALVDYDEASLKSETMIKIFDQMRKLRGDVDPNFSGRDWNIATSMVIKGEAAFQFMGDWAKGEITSAKVTPGVDILCTAAPSNYAGVFLYVANSFTFFKTGDGNVTQGQELLASTLMKPEVQAEFNLAKGSVPAVTGVDLSKFDKCAQDAAHDLTAADAGHTLLPALNGGMVSSGEIRGAVADAITKFFNSNLSSQEGVELLLKQIDTAR